jgi:hypothetical protein
MPKNTQNKGLCVIIDCKSTVDADKFRRITDIALKKLHEHPNWEDFIFLKIGDQLCFTHYIENHLLMPFQKVKDIDIHQQL